MNKLTIDSQTFIKAYNRIKFCVSKDESRWVIQNVLIDCAAAGASAVRMVATDGMKLGVAEIAAESSAPGKIMLPDKAMPEILDLASESKYLTIEWDDKNVIFNSQSSIPFDTGYPNFQQILDYDKPTLSATFPTLALKKAVKKMVDAVIVNRKQPRLSQSMKIVIGDGKIVLSPDPLQKWQTAETVAFTSATGAVTTAVNPKYLYSIIAACPDEEFTLDFNLDGLSPLGHKSGGVQYLLMPMRVETEWREIKPKAKKPSILKPIAA